MGKVKPDDIRFNELMISVEKGDIRIPDFQREFVWDQDQIIRLLDSIYRHYPIGSFLFWETTDSIGSFRKIGDIDLQRGDDRLAAKYVLDGQQRITSLFASLKRAKIAHRVNGKKIEKPLEIYFDLDEKCFVLDSFFDEKEKTFDKYLSSPPIPGIENYKTFIAEFLRFIRSNDKDYDGARDWITKNSDIAGGNASIVQGIFWCMGLYRPLEGICQLSMRGLKFLEDNNTSHLLAGLTEAIDGYDSIYTILVDSKEVTTQEVADALSAAIGKPIKLTRARNRMRWLVGLGVGELRDDRFTISEVEQNLFSDVLQAKESQREVALFEQEQLRLRYYSVVEILNMSSLVKASNKLGEDRQAALMEVHEAVSSYPFSVITIREQPIEVACEIFERVNNSGQVLSVVDLMVAKSWSMTFNLREKIEEFRKELRAHNYNNIPNIVLLQCAAGILQKAVNRRAILTLPNGTLEDNWLQILEAIRQAIDFLKSSLNIEHSKILPYNSLIVPLAFHFHRAKLNTTDQSTQDKLVRWFWRASVSNRYDSGAETKLGEDIREMDKLANGEEAEFNYLAPSITAERVIKQPMNTGSAFSKTILALLVNQGPLELKNASPVAMSSLSKFNSSELHHFFPQAYLKREDPDNYSLKDSMANIVFARASANKEYADKPPSVYLEESGNRRLSETLASHLVFNPEESGLWKDEFDTFLEYRAENIVRKLRELTGDMGEIEAAVMNDDSIVLESFERRFRNLIRRRLDENGKWLSSLSPEFQKLLDNRIQGWLRENPTRDETDVDPVEFCQILDYLKIVKSNKQAFEEIIRSTSDLESHLKTISTYRNALAHNRGIDDSSRQLALGALMWCDNIFTAAEIE